MATMAPEQTSTTPATSRPARPRRGKDRTTSGRRRLRLGDISLRKKITGSSLGAAVLLLAMAGLAVWGTTSAGNFASETMEHDVRSAQVVGEMRYEFFQTQHLSTASVVTPAELVEEVLGARDAALAELSALTEEYRARPALNDEAATLAASVQGRSGRVSRDHDRDQRPHARRSRSRRRSDRSQDR